MDSLDLQLSLYLSEREFVRHHENQRTNAASILIATASGLVALLSAQSFNSYDRTTVALMIIAIGIFGLLFCGKLSALIKMHTSRSYQYLSLIDDNEKDTDIKHVKELVKEEHMKKYPLFSRWKLSHLWSTFFGFIFLVGIFFLVTSFQVPTTP